MTGLFRGGPLLMGVWLVLKIGEGLRAAAIPVLCMEGRAVYRCAPAVFFRPNVLRYIKKYRTNQQKSSTPFGIIDPPATRTILTQHGYSFLAKDPLSDNDPPLFQAVSP